MEKMVLLSKHIGNLNKEMKTIKEQSGNSRAEKPNN